MTRTPHLTTVYRTLVSREVRGTRCGYVIATSALAPTEIDGAVAAVEEICGGPVSGTLTVHQQQATGVFCSSIPTEAEILRVDECEWEDLP